MKLIPIAASRSAKTSVWRSGKRIGSTKNRISAGSIDRAEAASDAYTSSRALVENERRYIPIRSKSKIQKSAPNSTVCGAPGIAASMARFSWVMYWATQTAAAAPAMSRPNNMKDQPVPKRAGWGRCLRRGRTRTSVSRRGSVVNMTVR